MMEFLIRSVVLSALGLIALFLLRRQSASLRHLVASISLLSIAALPLLTFFLPEQRVEAIQVPLVMVEGPATAATAAAPLPPDVVPALTFADALSYLWMLGSVLVALRFLVSFAQLRRR